MMMNEARSNATVTSFKDNYTQQKMTSDAWVLAK